MTPDDERRIARYVRRPDTLSDRERREIERMIGRDEAARAYAEVMETFYALLDAEEERATSDRVESFIDDLFAEEAPSAVVSLRPFHPQRSSQPTVLAAASEDPPDDRRFQVLTTLVAEEEDLMVRVIGDREAGQGRLYVISDDREREQLAPVVVSLPELGLDLVTDEAGRLAFDLPSDVEPEHWKETTAVVRRPLVSDRIASNETVELTAPSGAQVRCRRKNGTLTVTTTAPAGESSPSILTAEPAEADANRTLLRLQENEPIRHTPHADGDLIVRAYR